MKTEKYNMRIDSELKEQATEYAQSQGRSLANLIEYLLRKELSNKQQKEVEKEGV